MENTQPYFTKEQLLKFELFASFDQDDGRLIAEFTDGNKLAEYVLGFLMCHNVSAEIYQGDKELYETLYRANLDGKIELNPELFNSDKLQSRFQEVFGSAQSDIK